MIFEEHRSELDQNNRIESSDATKRGISRAFTSPNRIYEGTIPANPRFKPPMGKVVISLAPATGFTRFNCFVDRGLLRFMRRNHESHRIPWRRRYQTR
jgi:hypothetical protein